MANNTMFSLQGKVACVTGATSGIGRQQALALSAAGATIIAVGRNAEALESLMEDLPGNGIAVQTDLLNADLGDVLLEAIAMTGPVDILCNTAGINLREPAGSISRQSWNDTINLNLSVPFFLARELVPEMRERGGGKIINIASLQSERAFANSIAYGASKGGVAQLTRAMAEAWSADGICCNAIGPGFFPTSLTQAVFDNEEIAQRNARQTAIGRNGELKDLDGITVFLASSASDYITGQIIYVDGGFTAK
ncbi:gluconate 5-dehydrogenase [Chromatiales bacterium (ex Bugula neritina AB1)]|nr:gluconate 5-dehydrogenase [Chromatiales bacterium (ex Bugula neritina AB1)]